MLPYWLLFTLWAAGAVQADRRRLPQWQAVFFLVASVFTVLLIGLRFRVGGDWEAYMRMYDDISLLALPDGMRVTDPAYALINWVAARSDLGIGLVNLVCAGVFTGGIATLAWRTPNPALAMLIAVPYLVIVVAMGYTRQAAAIGVVCFAVATGSERRTVRLVVLIGIAALLHKTAILILPIVLRPVIQRNMLFGILGGLVFIVLFGALLRGSSDQLINSYVQGDYNSQGALVRILMNIGPACIYLILHKKMELSKLQHDFWMSCSILALVSVIGLVVASASSGIDRLALYLIPLQLVVYSKLPYVFSKAGKSSPSILLGVIGYSLAVQYVWLSYADNAFAWLPYRTIIG